jgi:iron(III) transport system permease protein
MRLSKPETVPTGLLLGALGVGLLAVTPLIYIVLRAVGADADVWARLLNGRVQGLMANTVALVISSAALTAVLGVALAWLVERTDLPGRGFWRWGLAMPLAIPAYVGALCYLILFRRGGLFEQALIRWGGLELGQVPLPPLFSLVGVTIVIGLFTFPYVYLPVAAALRSTNRTLEEAARMSGRGAWGAFASVALPLAMPAILAGVLLVSLYVVSDFGTVSLLRYQTFTTAIYNQFTGNIDRSGAAALSFVLLLLALPLLVGEGWFNSRGRRYTGGQGWKPRKPAPLGRWKVPALLLVALVATLSLVTPLVVLGGYSLQGWLSPTQVDRIWSAGGENVLRYGWNSLLVAGLAATIAMALSFAPALLAARHPKGVSLFVTGLAKAGYALPGLIVGLSLIMLFSGWAPAIYGTVVALVLAFAIRFLPQAITAGEAAFKQAPPSLEQAARSMGRTPWQVFREVTLPVAAPGILAGWALVFLTAMKELPTAILLRPPGFDTLPVRIWAATGESIYSQAAPPAFLLVVITVIPVALLYSRSKIGIDKVIT